MNEVEAVGHVLVELADVRAVELDDVDVDQGDVLAVVADDLADRVADGLSRFSGNEPAARARLNGKVGLRHGLEIAVDQRAEDGLLVGEVVVDVPLRQAPPPRRCRARWSRRSLCARRASARRRGSGLLAIFRTALPGSSSQSILSSARLRNSVLDHLAVRRARQSVEEDEAARHFVLGDALRRGSAVSSSAGAVPTTNATPTSPQVSSGYGDDRGIGDRRMRDQLGLDLRGIDVHAAADEHLLPAAGDVEEAVVVAARQIAGAEPAVRRAYAARVAASLFQ